MRYLSLFSGIEAATVAWEPLGWECAGVAEIEPFPCAVLAHHYPSVPNLGSVTDIADEQISALGQIDLVVGGSPCQDLSVAGKRVGLAGERSGLFSEQMRIFHAARRLCGARWLLWENVPGAFSSNRGRDFAAVVSAMAGCEFSTPRRWQTGGAALGPSGLVEWRVLDAQYFGLAQRRKRVFALLDTGDWASRPPILLERESLCGDSPPRRGEGEGAAGRTARSLAIRGRDGIASAELGEDVANAILTPSGGRGGIGVGAVLEGPTHTLRAEHDASEDGTGRGTPLVPVQPFEVANCLTQRMHKGINTTLDEGQTPVVSFHPTQEPISSSSDVCHALGANANATAAVAFTASSQANSYAWESEVYPTLNAQPPNDTSNLQYGIRSGMSVRRLTVRECERLQGFPDDYTLIPYRNKPADQCPDGPRYKALGNSMAVPVMRWIGERVAAATLVPDCGSWDEMTRFFA